MRTKLLIASICFSMVPLVGAKECIPATKEKPLAKLKIGEKTYEKVYVHSFNKKTGRVELEHAWGAKGINLEKLTPEQQKALGLKNTLSEDELAKNRKKEAAATLAYIKESEERAAKNKAAQKTETAAVTRKPATTAPT